MMRGRYVGAHDPIGYLQLMIIRMGRYPNATDSGTHVPCYCDGYSLFNHSHQFTIDVVSPSVVPVAVAWS